MPPMTDGVDITLKTSQGLKMLFIPCADSTDARLLGKRVIEAMQLDGMPVVDVKKTKR